ncbi:hypothetical protein AYX13_07139 [Cryptococcus neoformans]|nr:hypothetical protein AYX13_07139 [Cryptococcus neoformans var. grubii]
MASARHFFKHQALRDAARILAWVPVGVFFTRHVYSLATVTGGSMQVSPICLSLDHSS